VAGLFLQDLGSGHAGALIRYLLGDLETNRIEQVHGLPAVHPV
jgi:hypothetical protein